MRAVLLVFCFSLRFFFFFLFAIVVFLFVCVRAIVCGGGVLIDNGDVNCYRHFVVVFNVDLKSVKEDKQDVILFAWGSLFFFFSRE